VSKATPSDEARLEPDLLDILACPDCKAPIAQEGTWLVCQNADCAKRYPIRDGIPVMLVEEAVDPKAPQPDSPARVTSPEQKPQPNAS
jgi:uncharacterized protein YbaR (Trm112 family)